MSACSFSPICLQRETTLKVCSQSWLPFSFLKKFFAKFLMLFVLFIILKFNILYYFLKANNKPKRVSLYGSFKNFMKKRWKKSARIIANLENISFLFLDRFQLNYLINSKIIFPIFFIIWDSSIIVGYHKYFFGIN